MVRLLANPLVLRSVLVLFTVIGAFVFAIWLMRRMRQSIASEADFGSGPAPSLEALPLHLYNTVIQQLKQQKHELQLQNQAEQRRARTTENFSQAVLSNLSSGVLVFGVNGLVKQANPAAKNLLGFQSPSGMSAEAIFRDAVVSPAQPAAANDLGTAREAWRLTEEVLAVLREGSKCRQFESDYTAPSGKKLRLAITISPVPAPDGNLLGAALLITDRTELQQVRRQQQLQGEISAEMALELRTSLATIAGYAQRLARSDDSELAPQLASDIASEAARLDSHIGGFLAARSAAEESTSAAASAK